MTTVWGFDTRTLQSNRNNKEPLRCHSFPLTALRSLWWRFQPHTPVSPEQSCQVTSHTVNKMLDSAFTLWEEPLEVLVSGLRPDPTKHQPLRCSFSFPHTQHQSLLVETCQNDLFSFTRLVNARKTQTLSPSVVSWSHHHSDEKSMGLQNLIGFPEFLLADQFTDTSSDNREWTEKEIDTWRAWFNVLISKQTFIPQSSH